MRIAKIVLLTALAGVLGFMPATLFAANYDWDVDANGAWNVDGNWDRSGFPDASNDNATFGNIITADRTITLGQDITIKTVTFERTLYNELPYKFEAGTPHIAGAIGLAAGLDYVAGLGLDRVHDYEQELLVHGTELLSDIPGVRLIGTARRKSAVLSFVLDDVHAHDVGTVLDREGVAVRAGHHCAQPVMDRFDVAATARASFGLYNTEAEVDALADAILKVKELFG